MISLSFLEVAWFLWIPALIIGWFVVSTGPTISNTFYGLGGFTAVVTILYVLTEDEIPSGVKVIILFIIAFVAIGVGYYIGKEKAAVAAAAEEEEEEEEIVNQKEDQ